MGRKAADFALAAPELERLGSDMSLGDAHGLDIVLGLDLFEADELAARLGEQIEPVITHRIPPPFRVPSPAEDVHLSHERLRNDLSEIKREPSRRK